MKNPIRSMLQALVLVTLLTGLLSCGKPQWVQIADKSAISAISEDNSLIWIGTKQGVILFDKKTEKSTTLKTGGNSGLPDNDIRDIVVDKTDKKWIATALGVAGYNGQDWEPYDRNNSKIPANNVLDLEIDKDGHLWAGTGAGLGSFDGKDWKSFTDTTSDYGANIYCLAIDANGVKWMGTENGLISFDGKSVAKYDSTNKKLQVPQVNYRSIAIDHKGVIWLGSARGLISVDGTTVKTYTTANGLPDNIIKSLAVDISGALWVGTTKGAAKYDGSSWSVFNFRNTPKMQNERITSLYCDKDGNVFIGTEGVGVLVHNPEGVSFE